MPPARATPEGGSGTAPALAIITTSGCRFCAKAKAALAEAGIPYAEYDLGAAPSALAAVKAASGRATVPQVFIDGVLVGGADDTVAALEAGTLAPRLAAAEGKAPLPAAIEAALGEAAQAGTAVSAAPEAGPPPPIAGGGVSPADLARLEGVAAGLAAGVGAAFTAGEATAWLRQAGHPPDALDGLGAARLVSLPWGGCMPPGFDADALRPALSGLPPSTPLLLVRTAGPARPPTPLNARFVWLGPARPAALVAAGLRARILALYDTHLAPGGRGVDYAGLSADPAFSDFALASAELQAVGAAALAALPPRPDRAALAINLYNALVVHATAERGAPADSPSARSRFFGAPGYALGREGALPPFSPDDLEHGILRCGAPSPGTLAGLVRWPGASHFRRGDPRAALALPPPVDPRIHAALVCGAKSCPPVRVYGATGLDAALDAAVSAFVEGDDAVAVDEGRRAVTLSPIFKWYARDFPGPVLAWLPPFLPAEKAAALRRVVDAVGVEGVRVVYAPYDWSVNAGGGKQ